MGGGQNLGILAFIFIVYSFTYLIGYWGIFFFWALPQQT